MLNNNTPCFHTATMKYWRRLQLCYPSPTLAEGPLVLRGITGQALGVRGEVVRAESSRKLLRQRSAGSLDSRLVLAEFWASLPIVQSCLSSALSKPEAGIRTELRARTRNPLLQRRRMANQLQDPECVDTTPRRVLLI